jgi:hypothetical protein
MCIRRSWVSCVVAAAAGCGTGVDLQVDAPVFVSSTLSTTAGNAYSVRFRIVGELPGDSEDIYVTVEYRKPGASGFVFDQNAQVQRPQALLQEPVDYIFHVNDGPGTYAFRAVVDAGGLIDEDDEGNNVSSVTTIATP